MWQIRERYIYGNFKRGMKRLLFGFFFLAIFGLSLVLSMGVVSALGPDPNTVFGNYDIAVTNLQVLNESGNITLIATIRNNGPTIENLEGGYQYNLIVWFAEGNSLTGVGWGRYPSSSVIGTPSYPILPHLFERENFYFGANGFISGSSIIVTTTKDSSFSVGNLFGATTGFGIYDRDFPGVTTLYPESNYVNNFFPIVSITVPVAPLSCVDSDGGLNYNTYGSTNATNISYNNGANQPVIASDICLDSANSNRLIETTCNGITWPPGYAFVNYDCPYGCNNGACSPAPVSVCGNGVREGSEICDRDSRACTTKQGSGTQACNSQCNGWNTCQVSRIPNTATPQFSPPGNYGSPVVVILAVLVIGLLVYFLVRPKKTNKRRR